MTPTFRVKFTLLAIGSILATTFAWNAAQGQMRPRRPPIGPGINPPRLGPRMPGPAGPTNQYTCPNCGYIYRGMVPPDTCPGCKMHMNNGVGNGIAGPGDIGNFNPRANNPGMQPFSPPPMLNPPTNGGGNAVNPVDSSAGASGFSLKKVLIVVVVVLVAGGAFLAGGACLLIHFMRNNNSSSEDRPRRRKYRDD